MRIALIAPIWEQVPPPGYGGIERVVDTLTRHLIARGHDVTLFATGDSQIEANVVSTEPVAMRLLGYHTWSAQACEGLHLATAFARRDFDVYHNHAGSLGVAFAEAAHAPCLTTLHGPLNDENRRYFAHFKTHPYVSISDAQRQGEPALNYLATVYNGIESGEFALGPKQGYLLYIGRISPEKGVHLAIAAARESGWPLILAGKVDPYDQAYYQSEILPWLDGEQVRFIGEVGGQAKRDLIAGAHGLLHLVQWHEPFGLTMVEAMASGTPVVALPYGSIPEIVEPGVTGFVARRVEDVVEAIGRLGEIDSRLCRQRAITRFDASRMVSGYEALYRQILHATQPVPASR